MTDKKDYYDNWPERYFCSVLDEMRQSHKTRNYSYLPGLIEELQVLGNRMEAGLGKKKNLRKLNDEYSKLKGEYNKLVDEYNKVAKKKNRLEKVKEDD